MKKEVTSIEAATHAELPPTKAKFAFTLAEVLITLGIIGVVAAMTIPTLMANMTGTRYRSQFKKAVSTLSQAARLNKAKYDWDYADVNIGCSATVTDFQTHTSETHMSVCAIMNSNLSGKQGFRQVNLEDLMDYKFKGTTVGITSGSTQYTIYSLSDGTLIGFRGASFSSGCSLAIGETLNDLLTSWKCTGFIDVNGFNLPNEETKCSVGTTTKKVDESCIVKTKDIKDVFPIVFHDDIVEGATNAARYVLQTAK